MDNQSEKLKLVNRSGFPFQLKIEDDVRKTSPQHRWVVASREQPWASDKGESGFIDLVLTNENRSPMRLVIECKRVKADDSRQLRWIFLLPDIRTEATELASCFEIRHLKEGPEWADLRV